MTNREMSFNDFCKYVEDNILDYVDAPEDSVVEIREVVKQNDLKLHGMTIMTSDACVSPVIYLDNLYANMGDKATLGEVLGFIANEYGQAMKAASRDIDMNLDYEHIKDKVEMRVVDKNLNRERLSGLLSYPLENGFYGTFHIVMDRSEDGHLSAPISKELARDRGYDVYELLSDATKNMERDNPATFVSIEEAMFGEMLDEGHNQHLLSDMTDISKDEGIYVLTNVTKDNGAASLWLSDNKAKIGELLGNDYFVLPSSNDEVIILPVSVRNNPRELMQMVQDVNRQCVEPGNILSDKVLRYDRERGKLITAASPHREMQREEAR